MAMKHRLLVLATLAGLLWICLLVVDVDLYSWRFPFSTNNLTTIAPGNDSSYVLTKPTDSTYSAISAEPINMPPITTTAAYYTHPVAAIEKHTTQPSDTSYPEISSFTPDSLSSVTTNFQSHEDAEMLTDDPSHILNFAGCKMKYYKPYDTEVLLFYKDQKKDSCGVSFAKAAGNTLFVDKRGMARHFQIHKKDIICIMYEIRRSGGGTTDDVYGVKVVQELVTERYAVTQEFLQLQCMQKNGTIIYEDFFAFIQKKEKVERTRILALKELASNDKRREKFNVVFVGLDSVSHRNFLRQLPKTYDYLKQNFDVLEYHGYTKVGENTFPCLLPMFTGKSVEELHNEDGPYDSLPFIWKNFTSLGYRTLLAEDYPDIALFNYLKKGFYAQPTDYYLRPFYMAVDQSIMKKNGKENCFNGRQDETVLLQWVKDFMSRFKDDPFFSFLFMTRTTHGYLNDAGLVDDPMVEFFQWFKIQPTRKRTFMILFSDHGLRWGRFRQTEMGAQEDSLPLFLLMPPPGFGQKYPHFFRNLKRNQHRLVTLYDVHEMLIDIINFDGSARGFSPTIFQRGISLFDEIPTERTCDDAGIGEEFCVCNEREPIDASGPLALSIANKLVAKINNITNIVRQKCEILQLQNVISARRYTAYKRSKQKTIKTISSFKMRVHTVPGGGLFEGIVDCDVDNMMTCVTHDHIERINKYGTQSACITQNSQMRNYCYCSNHYS